MPAGRLPSDLPPRGDTDFSQTKHLDRWDRRRRRSLPVRDRRRRRRSRRWAEALPAQAYSFLERPPKYAIKTAPRERPERVKAEIVREREFETIHTARGDGRRVRLSPGRLPEELSRGRAPQAAGYREGAVRLREEFRYFFLHHQRSRDRRPTQIVFKANDRCDQENLIAQLKGGVHALTTPVGDLVSNWAYMVMASLAWS